MDESGMMVNAIDDVFCRSFSSVLLSSSFYSSTSFSSAVLLHLHRLHLFLEFAIFLLHGKENTGFHILLIPLSIPLLFHLMISAFIFLNSVPASSVRLFVCLSVCLSIYLSVCLFTLLGMA